MFFSGINHNCFDCPQVGNYLLQVGTHKNEENYGSCSLLCVCMGGGGVWWDGRGVVGILQSFMGVIRSIYRRRTKILLPLPPPPGDEKMTSLHLVIYSYVFGYSFILFIYLFIHF